MAKTRRFTNADVRYDKNTSFGWNISTRKSRCWLVASWEIICQVHRPVTRPSADLQRHRKAPPTDKWMVPVASGGSYLIIYEFMCVYIYICIYIYIYVYNRIYIYIYTCIYVYTYVYMYICIYVYIYICRYIRIFYLLYTDIYIYILITQDWIWICPKLGKLQEFRDISGQWFHQPSHFGYRIRQRQLLVELRGHISKRQLHIFKISWLVVGPPLWKILKSIGMMKFPIYGKIKHGNQTTNQ